MAKIQHNNFLDSVNDVFTDAKKAGVLHLYADGDQFSGRTISIENNQLFHFGTTGYLGLEQDPRLKQAAINAITKYGTQFPLSKSYISNPLYKALEEKIFAMYNYPIVITKNSTLGHLGVIPSAVKDQDAIILDHQVHWSVQSAAKVLKSRSVPIDMVRHNDLNMLEDKIKLHSKGRRKIWYMADGIYSMFGDFAPVKELKMLSDKYPQLHLYFDDVHGMSWIGKNGSGYVMSELGDLSDNMLLFGTLSKTFGASGSVLVCPNKKMYEEIKTFGGPLTFSAQLEPASVAAATASAEIHLSPEIYALQNALEQRVTYFNDLLKKTELPLIDKNNSPVFFIGTGMPKTGYNFVNRLMKEGYYTNLGLFPAVPVKNTGVRITISLHNQKEEIKGLVEAMAYHLPKALEDTHTDLNRVQNAFKLDSRQKLAKQQTGKDLSMTMETTITKIDKTLWNKHIGQNGIHDWDGLLFLEQTFMGNKLKEHNWKFYYVLILDKEKKPVLATFITVTLWKDDMLANVVASKAIEKERQLNPYHLTSKVLALGCLFTEGQHLYTDDTHPLKNEALIMLMKCLELLEAKDDAKMIVLRDFHEGHSLHTYFQGQGFVRIQMPKACEIHLRNNESIEHFTSRLSARNRKHLRKEILAYEPLLNISILQELDYEQVSQVHNLYSNVQQHNLGLNTFVYPEKLFRNMSKHPNWEFIILSPKDTPQELIGVMFCYKNRNTYVPSLVGMDYNMLNTYHTYRQLLFQTIKRAIDLNFQRINLGLTASFEKRKLGATVHDTYAYIQTSDNFTLELIGLMESN